MRFRERAILHLNIADFPVAVERAVDTSLKDKAVIVAMPGSSRATVHDMSDEAFRDGVRKGMFVNQATKLCRSAHILPPKFSLYQKAMDAFVKEAGCFTPLMEYGTDDGHLYLDVTGTHRLFGLPPDVGLRLQREMRKKLSLYPIWTFASNKLIAKVASRLVKPVGEYIVEAGEERAFLAPLSISILPGLKDKEKEKLTEFNINGIGQLATLTKEQLSIPFGKRSEFIHQISRGIDASNVTEDNPADKAISLTHTFTEDTNDKQQVEALVSFLASSIALTLRQQERNIRRVGIWLTYSDGSCCVRNATNKQGSALDKVIIELAMLALQRAWRRRVRIRSCKISGDLFQTPSRQLDLFAPIQNEQKQNALTSALDTIKNRYGNTAILTGKQSCFQEDLEPI